MTDKHQAYCPVCGERGPERAKPETALSAMSGHTCPPEIWDDYYYNPENIEARRLKFQEGLAKMQKDKEREEKAAAKKAAQEAKKRAAKQEAAAADGLVSPGPKPRKTTAKRKK